MEKSKRNARVRRVPQGSAKGGKRTGSPTSAETVTTEATDAVEVAVGTVEANHPEVDPTASSLCPRPEIVQGVEIEDHPIAAIYPLMRDEELRALSQDIAERGLATPIVIYESKVLDGRNRYRACKMAGASVSTTEYAGNDPMGDVCSWNGPRRHLMTGQKAAVAAELMPMCQERARNRQGTRTDLEHGGNLTTKFAKARDEAARLAGGVSGRYVDFAIEIMEADRALFDAVKSGDLGLMEALRQIRSQRNGNGQGLPTGDYGVIYADPPWSYGNTQPDYHGEQRDFYGVMPLDEICALRVPQLSASDSVLFLWTTSPCLEESFEVINAWGFKYKASFVWDKIKHNMGHYNSVRHEFLLIATKGACQPEVRKLFDSVVAVERTTHSKKPDEFYEIIETLYPHAKKIELFARNVRDGWNVWGKEAPSA